MKTPVTVRIEAELLSEVRRCAREENRTLTNFIETVLRQKVGGSSSRKSGQPAATGRIKEKPSHVA